MIPLVGDRVELETLKELIDLTEAVKRKRAGPSTISWVRWSTPRPCWREDRRKCRVF